MSQASRHRDLIIEIRWGAVEMDSGAIDLRSVAPLNPLFAADGLLDYNDTGAAYHPTGKLLGKINPPGLTNPDPPDEGETPKSWKQKPNSAESQARLISKKLAAARCPASIFTGRMRDYIQAHYGTPLDKWRFSLAEGLPSATPGLQSNIGTLFTTSTGIAQGNDGKYWFIHVEADGVKFYRGKTDAAAKRLIPLLSDDEVSDGDKRRIEAYIFAHTVPTEDGMQTFTDITIPAMYSMGYGWHFNRTGDKADIVVNELRSQGGNAYDYKSTHYRLTFQQTGTGAWGAALSTIEGPTYWKGYRHKHVICEPAWDDGTLSKFGSTLGPTPYGDAPFYCFYLDDQIQVCRLKNYSGSAVGTRVSSPTWFGGWGYDVPVDLYGIGYGSWSTTVTNAWSGTGADMSCGSHTLSTLEHSATGYTTSLSATGTGGYTWYGPGPPSTPENPSHLQTGFPTYIETHPVWGQFGGGLDWDRTTVTSGRWSASVGSQAAIATQDSSTWNAQNSGVMACVIPFYDSEAAYMMGSQTWSQTSSGSVIVSNSGGFMYAYYNHDDGSIIEYARASDGSGTTISNTPYTNQPSSFTTLLGSYLITRAGKFDVDVVAYVNQFWEGTLESVSASQDTRTAASGEAVWSHVILPVEDGYNDALFQSKPAVFIGWA
jgi:hypothetical protein